jgi:hypothetical protein
LHSLEFRFQAKDGPANLANRNLHHDEWPVPSENNEEAIDSRRDLAENGLYFVDLESRFSAVLSKAAEVAYCQIDVDRSPGNRSDQKVAEVSEKAEGTKMASLRLAGSK